MKLAGKNWEMQDTWRLMTEITSGMDELGVLLMGHEKGAYWYSSRLTIEEARALAPNNNATSLRVCVAVLAGMIHAIENPNEGVLEADELDHARALEICIPYLGEMAGVYSDWTPLRDRGAVPGGCRHRLPVAVQELPGRLTRSSTPGARSRGMACRRAPDRRGGSVRSRSYRRLARPRAFGVSSMVRRRPRSSSAPTAPPRSARRPVP